MACQLYKVACNATNSAAIDHMGNVYLWGTSKYGLYIDKDTKAEARQNKVVEPRTYSVPCKLDLFTE